MTMTTADLAAGIGDRAAAYAFLAICFGGPLSGGLLQRMATSGVGGAQDGEALAVELKDALSSESDWPALAQRLAVEHARLFLGLREGYGPPPPYESLWRGEQVMGDSTPAVASAYAAAGFVAEGPPAWGPCDHLAFELRFMASLCHAEEEALGAGDTAQVQWARGHQARFLREHLLAWFPRYSEHLAMQAREALYRTLARVTVQMLSEDAKALPVEIAAPGLYQEWASTDLSAGEIGG
jgi:TorA maturation chaperone TorD